MNYQHRVLDMLALLSVITYLDRVCIAVAGPRMQDDLNISPEMWGWVIRVVPRLAVPVGRRVVGRAAGHRNATTGQSCECAVGSRTAAV